MTVVMFQYAQFYQFSTTANYDTTVVKIGKQQDDRDLMTVVMLCGQSINFT